MNCPHRSEKKRQALAKAWEKQYGTKAPMDPWCALYAKWCDPQDCKFLHSAKNTLTTGFTRRSRP